MRSEARFAWNNFSSAGTFFLYFDIYKRRIYFNFQLCIHFRLKNVCQAYSTTQPPDLLARAFILLVANLF